MPEGVVSTGWASVREKCRDLNITFRWWQHTVGQIILAKRSDGKYAATIGGTGLSIPRQVGKTFLVGAIVFALCLLYPNLTVIWTAHRVRTAEETFGKMQKFARRAKVAPHIAKIVLGSGEEEVRFHNGSRILFGARESGFGLGFDEVDILIFDEAQRLRGSTLEDMIPATNQSRQPSGALLLFMGTPPRPTDPGEVFTRMRTDALSGEDMDTGWVEFGSDPEHVPAEVPAPLTASDWRQVAKANPSFPDDTPREAILRMRKKLGSEAFLREGLGIWLDPNASKVFGPGMWEACVGSTPSGVKLRALGVAVSLDLTRAAIVGAGTAGDRVFVRTLAAGEGVDWLPAQCEALQRRHRAPLVVDMRGPAADLIPQLQAAGLKVHKASSAEVKDAFSVMYRLVTDRQLLHEGLRELDSAVSVAVKRAVEDRYVWGRRTSGADISPLEAATLACWWAMRPSPAAPPPPRPQTTGAAAPQHELMTRGF